MKKGLGVGWTGGSEVRRGSREPARRTGERASSGNGWRWEIEDLGFEIWDFKLRMRR